MKDKRRRNNRTAPSRREESVRWQQGEREESRAQNGKRHKRKRRVHTRVYLMVLLLMLTIGVVLIFTVFFKVASIQVAGLTRYSPEDVVQASGIVEGVNLFRLNRKGIAENLVNRYSYMEEVTIRLSLPDAVIIQVEEAEPVGAIQQGERYLLFSEKGRILEAGAAEPPENAVVVKGFNALSIERGDYLLRMVERIRQDAAKSAKGEKGESAEQKAARLAQKVALEQVANQLSEQIGMVNSFLAAQKEAEFEGVGYIDVGDKYNLVVGYEDRVEVEFGSEADLTYKMQCVKMVLDEKLSRQFEGRIDASKAGTVRVRRLSLEAQGMTEEEYAEYLYRQSTGEESSQVQEVESSSEAASQPQSSGGQQPARESSKPSSHEDEVLAEEEIPGEEEDKPEEGDEPSDSREDEDAVYAEEE